MPDTSRCTIVLFGNDLRVDDLPALDKACQRADAVIPLFVQDTARAGDWAPGGASLWWRHHALVALDDALQARGSRLILRNGDTLEHVQAIVDEHDCDAIHFTRRYEPWAVALQKDIHDTFASDTFTVKRCAGALLFEPEDVRTGSGDAYKVFTPMWRAMQELPPPREPLKAPDKVPAPERWPKSEALDDWGLLPTSPDWAGGLRETWTPGPEGAQARLTWFCKNALETYASDRDRPDKDGTSGLSPFLHSGNISPNRCWYDVLRYREDHPATENGAQAFLRELGWREFSHQLLTMAPGLPDQAFKSAYDAFPWDPKKGHLKAWQRGQTGFPIVDAGMRQLYETGWMHNRVRMIVASLLIKHLLIDWREGEAWFWDTLVDADLANNAAGWQWVAGSGADASPFFRIFNPMTQGAKFDPDGDYVRRWVPELAKMPTKHLNAPWEAPADVLRKAGVKLGETYPEPLVDHKSARNRALEAFEVVKAS